ncbi:D-aminoacyl-tRNA deacylase [Actinomyces vulturis]|uniref:D-aminoacyl-tRNA deacylase n=1 Tax=Actinomyces vulturis TaxID=1857645 RepID=UPI000831DC93|nr:D-aminoacyl-tRNA deacylase [Actinomyces vulturis]
MRAVIQRVNGAKVTVDSRTVGAIEGEGLMVLIGATHDDAPDDVAYVVKKIANLRLLEGELSVLDAEAPILVVSQFTLYADIRKGRRPSWFNAAGREVAEPLVEQVVTGLREHGLTVATGEFGADMMISMNASGPVTIWVDSRDR